MRSRRRSGTMTMNATPIVVVKQETDVVGEDVDGGTITKFDMKSEPQKSGMEIQAETSRERFEVKSEPLEEQAYNDQISPLNNVGESFLIYELEEVPRMATLTTTTTTATITKPTLINSKLRKKRALKKSTKTQSSMIAKKPALETDVATAVPATTTPAAAKITTSTKSLPVSSNKPATLELKVKCLCRLGNPVAASSTNILDLKNFFDEMFNETRQLSRSQQREVKMALLKAISEAEEYWDAGRWCDKCCSS